MMCVQIYSKTSSDFSGQMNPMVVLHEILANSSVILTLYSPMSLSGGSIQRVLVITQPKSAPRRFLTSDPFLVNFSPSSFLPATCLYLAAFHVDGRTPDSQRRRLPRTQSRRTSRSAGLFFHQRIARLELYSGKGTPSHCLT